MALLGNPANTNGVDGALPREGAGYGASYPFSRERLNQTRAVLSRGLNAALGKGILAGGAISSVSGLSIKMASGTTLFLGGVALTLDADLTKNILVDSATNTIWATLKKTPANYALRTSLETYAADLAATTDGNPPPSDPNAPADSWWPVAVVAVASGTPGTFNNFPPGKFAPILRCPYGKITMAASNHTATAAEYSCELMDLGGTGLVSTRNLVVPLYPPLSWRVRNGADQSVQVIGASGTGTTIAAGKSAVVASDGTNIFRISADA